MSEVMTGKDGELEPSLNRLELVESLKQLGIDVDLNDFDELDDNDLLGVIATLGLEYDFDLEEVLRAVVDVEKVGEESIGVSHIVRVLAGYGIDVDAESLAKLDSDRMQRAVVYLIKGEQGDYEKIGRECFGDVWQDGRWQ